MRRFIAALCCVIVGAQILIGVPLAVCIAFLMHFSGDLLGTTSVEFRVANSAQQQALPPGLDQREAEAPQADAVLEAREQRGSLLAGTMLGENVSPADEQSQFVAAFRQAAEEDVHEPKATHSVPLNAPANVLPEEPAGAEVGAYRVPESLAMNADQFAIEHLYLMAEKDEQAGCFARADQWRELARAIRGPSIGAAGGCSAAGGPCAFTSERQ